MMKITSILLLALVPIVLTSTLPSAEQSAWKTLDFLMTNYDKRIRPDAGSGHPVNITVSMFVLRAYDFNPNVHSMKMEFIFKQKWSDPRLAFKVKGVTLTNGNELLNKIWKPDTFFALTANEVVHSAPNPNLFVKIYPDGQIEDAYRITADVFCDAKKNTFPTKCVMEIESYGNTADDIVYKWKNDIINGVSRAVVVGSETFLNEEYRLVTAELQEQTVVVGHSGMNIQKNYSRIVPTFIVDKAEQGV